MARHPVGSRKLSYRIIASASLVLALLAGLVAFAQSASAHSLSLTGVAACQEDGTYTITWTLSNDYGLDSIVHTYSVSPNLGTTNLTADGSYTGGTPYHGSGTVVPANKSITFTTTGVVQSTPSITLTVAGTWTDGFMQDTPPSYKVDLTSDCSGNLKITKTVTGQSAPPAGTKYTIAYNNGTGTSGTVQVQAGQTVTVSSLPFGTYTLSEVSPLPGDKVTITPNPVTVSPSSRTATIGVTNTFPDLGGFNVTKQVTGATAGYVAGSKFSVAYSCSNDVNGTLTLINGQTQGVTGLPIGTTCTLSEGAKPATTDASYAWGTETWNPSNSVTIVANGSGNTVGVTLDNPLVRVLGGFTVTKHVTGETGGYVAGSQFTVAYSCSNAVSGNLTLIDGQTQGVTGLPIGTTCTLSETAKPATRDSSYSWGTETWSPSNSVTIVTNGSGNTVGVTLDNPLVRVLGGFTVTKHVTGETAGYVAGSQFTVAYSCSNGASGNLTLVDGGTQGVTGLPIGTTCTLSETAKPATTDASYAWGTQTWDPSNSLTIVKNSSANTVGVTLTNPLVRVLGGFTVTKHVTGQTAGYVAGSKFTVSYSCSDGTTGSLQLADGGTGAVNNLPIGTTCALSESAKPATTDASYAWGTPTWDPSSSVTIAVNSSSNTVGVTLDNPLVRVLGGFTVTKHVTGETGGYVAGSQFTVAYSCSNAVSGNLTLVDGQTQGVSGLPIGTTCTLSETGKPATTDASYAWGTQTWNPSSSLTIVTNGSGNTVGVVLTNPLVRVLGGFTVTKHVTGQTGGYVAGSQFTVSYTCTDGTTGDMTLIDGATGSVNGLPIGTTCTLAETNKPATKDASYVWGTETWDPSNSVSIVTNGDSNTVGVTLSNPLVRVEGGFTVTKHVTGATGGYVAGTTFPVNYTCSDSSHGTLLLTDGATGSVTGLPIGTTCTLSEGAKPATKDASYAWGTESWDPSNSVTIVTNESNNVVGVVLSNPLVRVLGGFTVTKHVTGETGGYVAGSKFTVTYSCSDGTSGSLQLVDGGTGSVNSLPIGTTCTLSETGKPATTDASYAWGTPTWDPSSTVTIVVNSSSNTVGVVLTNPLVRVLGGFTVTKHVTGETGGYVAGSQFTVAYSCSNGGSGNLSLIDGSTAAVSGLPIGTTCTLAESAKPATTDASYAWGTETWDPSSTVTIVKNGSGNTVGVVLDNPLVRVLGGFTVTKHVTGETAGYVAGSKFTVSYTCTDGTTGSMQLVDGGTGSVSGLPIGTSCALSESAKAATKDASYAWGTETWDPSSTVTIVVNGSGNTVGVVLDNPLVRVLGGFTVTKHVTGETGGYVAGSKFTVSYTCSNGTTGSMQLVDGGTGSVSNLPIGTTCALSESAKPATTDASYAWGTETWDPSSTVTIVVNGSGNTVGVVLDNPLVRVLGGFTVTKHVTGETAGYVKGSSFTVSYTCSDSTTGTLTLTDGSTEGVKGLPIGTTCTLAESAKPATTDASYAWGTETWDPSSTVTIVVNGSGNTVGVVLTNPLVRVLGGFTVTKHVTGETAGYVAGSKFTVAYTCTDGTSGTLTLTDGDTEGVSGLPIGTSCSLSESAKPATKDASYAWGTETWDPSSTLTIVVNDSENTVGVVLTNPLVRVLGGFTVTKQVTGPIAGYVPGSTFTVSYTCSDGSAGTLTLVNGGTGAVNSLPIGTTCTLAETGKPATSSTSFTWGTETWSPSNTVTITANSSKNTVSVVLQNPLTQVLGETVTPPTTTAPATLPVTGAPDTIYLLIIGLMLMLAGGCFVMAAKVDE